MRNRIPHSGVGGLDERQRVFGGEEELECEVCVDELRLEHVSEFKYFGCVLDESGTLGQSAVGNWRV